MSRVAYPENPRYPERCGVLDLDWAKPQAIFELVRFIVSSVDRAITTWACVIAWLLCAVLTCHTQLQLSECRPSGAVAEIVNCAQRMSGTMCPSAAQLCTHSAAWPSIDDPFALPDKRGVIVPPLPQAIARISWMERLSRTPETLFRLSFLLTPDQYCR